MMNRLRGKDVKLLASPVLALGMLTMAGCSYKTYDNQSAVETAQHQAQQVGHKTPTIDQAQLRLMIGKISSEFSADCRTVVTAINHHRAVAEPSTVIRDSGEPGNPADGPEQIYGSAYTVQRSVSHLEEAIFYPTTEKPSTTNCIAAAADDFSSSTALKHYQDGDGAADISSISVISDKYAEDGLLGLSTSAGVWGIGAINNNSRPDMRGLSSRIVPLLDQPDYPGTSPSGQNPPDNQPASLPTAAFIDRAVAVGQAIASGR